MPSQTEYIVRSKYPNFEIPDLSMGSYIQSKILDVIEKNPTKIALIDPRTDRQVSYVKLEQIIHEVASGLLQLGLEKEDRVMFFGDNYIEYFNTSVALAYLGITITPSKPANGAYETYQQMISSKSRVLCITRNKIPIIEQMLEHDEYRSAIKQLKVLVVLNENHKPIPQTLASEIKCLTYNQVETLGKGQKLATVPHFPVNVDKDYFVIVYTSGTTGLPKGAIHTHRSFLACILNLLCVETFGKNIGSVFNLIFPFGHISGTIFLASAMAAQLTSVVFDEVDHEKVIEGIAKYRCDMVVLFQALSVDMLEKADEYKSRYDLSSMHTIMVGGSKFAKEITLGLVEKYGVNMNEVYGATEFMGSVANNSGKYVPGNVGSPLPNVEMKIIDVNTGASLPAYQEGEICFRGPMCFVGYLNNEKATKSTIDEDGWYHSGDIGYYDQENCLYITDRIKELIKYKHWSVAPAEIENFIQSHDSVASVCVVGVKHETEGQHLRAYVELFEGKDISKKEIIQMVKDNMGYQKRLNGGVEFIETMPRTVIGKVARQFFKNIIKNEILTEKAEPE